MRTPPALHPPSDDAELRPSPLSSPLHAQPLSIHATSTTLNPLQHSILPEMLSSDLHAWWFLSSTRTPTAPSNTTESHCTCKRGTDAMSSSSAVFLNRIEVFESTQTGQSVPQAMHSSSHSGLLSFFSSTTLIISCPASSPSSSLRSHLRMIAIVLFFSGYLPCNALELTMLTPRTPLTMSSID